MHTSPNPIDLPHVRTVLAHGGRAALFIRHSERPAIDAADKNFGQHLGLTPNGIEQARAAGRHLAGFQDARFLASPMNRCRLTARYIADGMGLETSAVEDADTLGVRGFFYDDPYAVQEVMRQQGYMAYMLDYLRDGSAPHSKPIGLATEKTINWLKDQMTTRLGVFVSHDIFIASVLTGLKLRTYTADNWVGFLHGAAFIQMPETDWVCHTCVPDLATENTPSQFTH